MEEEKVYYHFLSCPICNPDINSILILMSVMVPSQLNFTDGKTYSLFLMVEISSVFLEKGPDKSMVALGINP